ncbi:hypothetical protein ILYODFUR_016795 [Ilyodon furcidens]|uniref:RanBP2-type domain-containing protein n=1 Tax=Ilyodon furcidens TaxID=33524 RepID=A0ABV0U8Q7_9TELE
MGDKKSPTRPKRQAKLTADDGYWDCSVCTFRNTAEAFKCSICDVRKGTSTRRGKSHRCYACMVQKSQRDHTSGSLADYNASPEHHAEACFFSAMV